MSSDDTTPGDSPRRMAGDMLAIWQEVAPEQLQRVIEADIKRSMVRVYVTYMVAIGYLVIAAIVLLLAIRADALEAAIAILGSVAASAGTVIGFWFGTRGAGGTDAAKALTAPLAPYRDRAAAGGRLVSPTVPGKQDVRRVQAKLARLSTLRLGWRHAAALDPGPQDGVLGSSTVTAINILLGALETPVRYEDLPEPRLSAVEDLLDQEIAKAGAG